MTNSPSVSGLSDEHRAHARKVILQGVRLLMADQAGVHYTQGANRWEGIRDHKVITKGQYPKHGDCSSTTTWLLWNGIHVPYGVRDLVNNANWNYGYTGTQVKGGKRVVHDYSLKVGDLLFYGDGPTYEHVTMSLGGRKCFSHGGEAGPFILDIDYRPDRGPTRRYI